MRGASTGPLPPSEWAKIARAHALDALRAALRSHGRGRELFIDRDSRSIAVVLTHLTADELEAIETLAKSLFHPRSKVTVTCGPVRDAEAE